MTRLTGWLSKGRGGSGQGTPVRLEDVTIKEYRHGNRHVLRAELADVDPARDIQVSYLDGVVRVRLSRGSEYVLRTVRLPDGARPDTITARYADGVLEVSAQVGDRVLPGRDIPVRAVR